MPQSKKPRKKRTARPVTAAFPRKRRNGVRGAAVVRTPPLAHRPIRLPEPVEIAPTCEFGACRRPKPKLTFYAPVGARSG